MNVWNLYTTLNKKFINYKFIDKYKFGIEHINIQGCLKIFEILKFQNFKWFFGTII
jgi:hypothetical protein